jgi:hypothetical protein
MHGDICKSVYCHYDGYLDYAGRILLANYDSTLANALVARGDNSGVKETLEEMNFYTDRGEDNVSWRVAHTFDEFLDQVDDCWGEYYYVMKDGEWYVGALYPVKGLIQKGLVPLKDAVAAISETAAEETLAAEVLFK